MIPLGGSVHTVRWPWVTWFIILINAAVFYYEVTQPSAEALAYFIRNWALVPARFIHDPFGDAVTLFSSQFLHGGVMHFLGNMIYLAVFGRNIEDRLGHMRFLVYYLFLGVLAAFAQMYWSWNSSVPTIGASGAVAGILGSYFVLFPRAKISVFIPLWLFSRVVRLPSFLFLGGWFGLQACFGYGALQAPLLGGGVAWWAHIGGFVAGMIFIWFFKKR